MKNNIVNEGFPTLTKSGEPPGCVYLDFRTRKHHENMNLERYMINYRSQNSFLSLLAVCGIGETVHPCKNFLFLTVSLYIIKLVHPSNYL